MRTMGDDGNLVFGRYTREECGLPPVAGARRFGVALKAVFLLAGLVAAGWLAGRFTAGWREHWLSSLPAMVGQADPGAVPALLERGRMYVSGLPGKPRMRRDLAIAVMQAAPRAPRRLGYYANAANLFDGLGSFESESPEGNFFAALLASEAYAELGGYTKAFACLERADAALKLFGNKERQASFRLLLVNAQAYYLVTAPGDGGRDPGKALDLAQLMVSSRDQLPGGGHASDSAAFLDTLACALFANGRTDRAVSTQAYALGLAGSAELTELLRHHDDFAGDAASTR